MLKSSSDKLNLLSLLAIQGANASLPLLIFPYALTQLSTHDYSNIVIGEAIALVLTPILLYSFEINATSRGAILHKAQRRQELNRLLSTVIYIRLILFSLAVLFLLTLHFITYHRPITLSIYWLGVPLGIILQNLWYFRALQRNLTPALVTVFSRIFAVALTYACLPSNQKDTTIPLIIGSCYTIGGLATLALGSTIDNIRLTRISIHDVTRELRSGYYILLSNLSVSLYKDTNTLIIGLIGLPSSTIASYSLAEKFAKCLQAIARPLSQLAFPKTILALANIHEPNRAALKTILKHTYPQLAVLSTCTIILIIVTNSPIFLAINLFDNEALLNAVPLFIIMSFSVTFGVSNFMVGTIGLNHLNKSNTLFYIILSTGLLSILLCTILSYRFEATGTSIAFLLSEVILLAGITRIYIMENYTR